MSSLLTQNFHIASCEIVCKICVSIGARIKVMLDLEVMKLCVNKYVYSFWVKFKYKSIYATYIQKEYFDINLILQFHIHLLRLQVVNDR